MEGTNEKGKLGGGFCVRTLAGGGPQSNVAGPGEGVLSPSGFFDDQTDLAWCFVLRLPPMVLNGEGEVVDEKVPGGGSGGVIGETFVGPKRPVSSFWGVLNSILVLAIVEAFALSSGLSRTLNRTFFSLYADLSAFKVVAAAAAMEDVMLTAFPPLLGLSSNRVSLAGEDLGLWKDLRSSLDMRDDSLLISSICRAIAMSILRYVRLIVSKVGALKPAFPDFSLSNFLLAACRWLSSFSTLSRMLRTCFLSLACFSTCSGPRFRVLSILAKSGLLRALSNLAISSFLVHAFSISPSISPNTRWIGSQDVFSAAMSAYNNFIAFP